MRAILDALPAESGRPAHIDEQLRAALYDAMWENATTLVRIRDTAEEEGHAELGMKYAAVVYESIAFNDFARRGRWCVMAVEYQRRLSGAVMSLAAPMTILAASMQGASTILTSKGLRLRSLRRGPAGTCYEAPGGDA
jgi:hypothetical protein